eukprot:TRINITY_DN16156_c0_g1_i1.p1 TRINITY_DN16156_c0_g1~~TRINITY_DN16156_c0_g1_i1.p1  ORF type:complete len:1004 (+),score=224.60 TRINITY_DN16156_c0_g1_i1:125-3136(+)
MQYGHERLVEAFAVVGAGDEWALHRDHGKLGPAGSEYDASQVTELRFEPKLEQVYPRRAGELLYQAELFCLPDGVAVKEGRVREEGQTRRWDLSADKTSLFPYVLTSREGRRLYGSSLVFWDAVERVRAQPQFWDSVGQTDDPRVALRRRTCHLTATKALTVVSRYPLLSLHKELLLHVYRCLGGGQWRVEQIIQWIVDGMRLPASPCPLQLTVGGKALTVPPCAQQVSAGSLGTLLETVHLPTLLLLLRVVLLEKQVLLVAASKAVLSHVIVALCALLEPLHYLHVCIPLLPNWKRLRSITTAPVPYLIGVCADPAAPPAGSGAFVLNVDTGDVSGPVEELPPEFPERAASALRRKVQALTKGFDLAPAPPGDGAPAKKYRVGVRIATGEYDNPVPRLQAAASLGVLPCSHRSFPADRLRKAFREFMTELLQHAAAVGHDDGRDAISPVSPPSRASPTFGDVSTAFNGAVELEHPVPSSPQRAKGFKSLFVSAPSPVAASSGRLSPAPPAAREKRGAAPPPRSKRDIAFYAALAATQLFQNHAQQCREAGGAIDSCGAADAAPSTAGRSRHGHTRSLNSLDFGAEEASSVGSWSACSHGTGGGPLAAVRSPRAGPAAQKTLVNPGVLDLLPPQAPRGAADAPLEVNSGLHYYSRFPELHAESMVAEDTYAEAMGFPPRPPLHTDVPSGDAPATAPTLAQVQTAWNTLLATVRGVERQWEGGAKVLRHIKNASIPMGPPPEDRPAGTTSPKGTKGKGITAFFQKLGGRKKLMVREREREKDPSPPAAPAARSQQGTPITTPEEDPLPITTPGVSRCGTPSDQKCADGSSVCSRETLDACDVDVDVDGGCVRIGPVGDAAHLTFDTAVTCPQCSILLPFDQLNASTVAGDTYSAVCGSCSHRFVPHFTVLVRSVGHGGGLGAELLHVQYLSTAMLAKECLTLMHRRVAADADLLARHPTTFWNALRLLRDPYCAVRIPIEMVLPLVDWQKVRTQLRALAEGKKQ